MLTLQPSEFDQYARGLNLSSTADQESLAAALYKSFAFISYCGTDQWSVNSKIVFYMNSHTLAFASPPTVLSSVLPSMTWTLIGYEGEAPGPKNLEGMLLFIAEKLAKLAKLHFELSHNETFAKYLLLNFSRIHLGITNLKEYYQKYVPAWSKTENEAETLKRCVNIHETITASAGLIAGYSSNEIKELSDSYLNATYAHRLLSWEVNAPIKKLMTLGKFNNREAPFIQELFKGDRHIQFMENCLAIDPELFPQTLVPLYTTLEKAYEKRYHASNPHIQFFYLQILISDHFKDLHTDVAVKLLEKEKVNESEHEFQIRCQSFHVQEALSYVFKKMDQLKNQPIPEEKRKEQLTKFLNQTGSTLRNYPPFQQIFHFASVIVREKPADNNPGLPFNALGNYHVSDFVSQVVLSFDDLDSIDLSDSSCRKKLLECAEPIVRDKFSEDSAVDFNKLNRWLSLFPEASELACWPLIEKFLPKT